MPASRPFFVAGNWKMNLRLESARGLASGICDGYTPQEDFWCAVMPPFPYLPAVAEALGNGPVALGAQDCAPEGDGAHTGDISAEMLTDVGCKYVILGHSERRQHHGEQSPLLQKKMERARLAGLTPVICVGEPLPVRSRGAHKDYVADQLVSLLRDLAEAEPEGSRYADFVVAYEPIWAIGTGEVATPEQAQEMAAQIRGDLTTLGTDWADTVILYGGSVKPGNAQELASQPDVDGFLVGGASLKTDDFLSIITNAREGLA